LENIIPDIIIISMGTGHPDMLTAQAAKALKNIDIAVGAERFGEMLTVPLFEPKPLVLGTIEFIKNNPDKRIGVVVTGDAGFYSLAKSVVKEFGSERVTIVPGVSVVQAAFAAICEPWEDAVFISAHGREMSLEKAENAESFLILCGGANTPKAVIEAHSWLLERFELWVMSNLSLKNEKIIRAGEGELPEDALSCIVGIRK
jgi:cobalt-precorrin-7 (C5)-methyltransferase